VTRRPPRRPPRPAGPRGQKRAPAAARPAGPRGQKRALSTARAGGRIERGGDRALAEILADALRAPASEPHIAESLTHPLHTYPARMDPATARHLIAHLTGGATRQVVLDPFCGSGTTLVEARAAGLTAIGSDLNPLAVAIARAKTWTAPAARRAALRAAGGEIAGRVLAEGKAARRAGHRAAPLRRVGPDPDARDRAIGEWFAPHVRRELEQIGAEVDALGARDPELGEVLRVVLSSILYKVSRRASDTDPRRVERQVGRGQAARLLARRVDLLVAGLDDLARIPGPPVAVAVADARSLGRVTGPASADLIVTSPPYAGTYDYADLHGLRMLFLGMDPRAVARAEIGARSRFGAAPHETRRALARHLKEMSQALGEMARALRPGGRAVLMLGDSLAGREPVRADLLLRDALAALPERAPALALVAWASQERPPLGGAERRAFGAGAPKREHLMLVERPSAR